MMNNLKNFGLILALSLVLLATSVALIDIHQNQNFIAEGDDLPIYIGKSMPKG